MNLREGQVNPTPSDLVLDAVVDPAVNQTFFLWEEGNMASLPEHQGAEMVSGEDGVGFRPTVVTYPVLAGVQIKGAVLVNAGGAFQFRSNGVEGEPTAQALAELGYQSFLVNYRLRPYTQEEAALDLQRAVRFVRAHADDYGFDPADIAVMGFSAGGILSGEQALNFQGTVNGTSLDADYRPDALDEVSADVGAVGMIYSFYGRLSVASTDVEAFRRADLPPAFYLWGSEDPFTDQFPQSVAALREAGVAVEEHVLDGWPHGFGTRGGWVDEFFDGWLSRTFGAN